MYSRFISQSKYCLIVSLFFSLVASPLKAQTEDVIDLMVLYSDSAERERGGNIETYINSLVDASNTTYENSKINVRLRLIHIQKLAVPGATSIDGASLNAIASNARVQGLRAEHGADLVAYLEVAQRSNTSSFVCGIGYVAQGSNGQLAGYSRNAAYSITGSNCGSTSFTHELGHNMGLNHSRKQGNDSGGVYRHGLGYGVDNLFATTMAYDFIFNARRVDTFSNPNLRCANVACGVNRNQSDSADAALAVNQVSAGIAGYLPSQNDDDGTNEEESDPINAVPSIPTNIIENASAESGLNSWVQRFNANLSINNQRRFTGESSIQVGNRQYNYSGVSQDLKGKMVAGGEYKISANLRLANSGNDVAAMVISVSDDNGQRYEYFDRIGINGDAWTEMKEEFTLEAKGDIRGLFVHFYGPKAENDFYLDQVSITPVVVTPPPPEENPDIILNGGLEEGSLKYWQSGYNGTINLSAESRRFGSYSMYTLNRRNWYDGPMQRVTTKIKSGNTYDLSAWVGLGDTSTQSIQARLYYRDNSGGKWVMLANQRVGNRWTELKGSINLNANGPIQEARLHFFGPTPSSNFFVDEVKFIKR